MMKLMCFVQKLNQFCICSLAVVAKRSWELISLVIGINASSDIESISEVWLCNKKFEVTNMFTSALCWSL
jgi:hypothetical protein